MVLHPYWIDKMSYQGGSFGGYYLLSFLRLFIINWNFVLPSCLARYFVLPSCLARYSKEREGILFVLLIAGGFCFGLRLFERQYSKWVCFPRKNVPNRSNLYVVWPTEKAQNSRGVPMEYRTSVCRKNGNTDELNNTKCTFASLESWGTQIPSDTVVEHPKCSPHYCRSR